MFEKVKNWGRWGADDQKGTVNLITPQVRKRAASLVKAGQSYSISRPLLKGPGVGNAPRVDHHMLYFPGAPGTYDYIGIASHGYYLTHMDAIGHGIWEETTYNGFPLKVGVIGHDEQFGETQSPGGVSHDGLYVCGVDQYSEGIFTRGIFLDVAAARGVEYLGTDHGITYEDMALAEEHAGVRAEPGDAVFVRIGLRKQEEAAGGTLGFHERAGVLPSAVEWMSERDIAVFGADAVEKFPGSSPRFPTPFHNLCLVAMGLCLLDWPEVEILRKACAEQGRNEFLLTVAPLAVSGATGCVVNPIVTF